MTQIRHPRYTVAGTPILVGDAVQVIDRYGRPITNHTGTVVEVRWHHARGQAWVFLDTGRVVHYLAHQLEPLVSVKGLPVSDG